MRIEAANVGQLKASGSGFVVLIRRTSFRPKRQEPTCHEVGLREDLRGALPTGNWLISFEPLVYSPSAEAEIRRGIDG